MSGKHGWVETVDEILQLSDGDVEGCPWGYPRYGDVRVEVIVLSIVNIGCSGKR
jgi:hypothetical protein